VNWLNWWKSYVIYLAIGAPPMALNVWLIHNRWLMGAVTGVIVFAGLTLKDRIQRKIWP